MSKEEINAIVRKFISITYNKNENISSSVNNDEIVYVMMKRVEKIFKLILKREVF